MGLTTVSALARSEGMRPQSMGAAIAALEAAGLVRGAPDPDDGRQTIMSLTDADAASGCAPAGPRGRIGCRATIAAKLSAREQQELAAAVKLLKRLVED